MKRLWKVFIYYTPIPVHWQYDFECSIALRTSPLAPQYKLLLVAIQPICKMFNELSNTSCFTDATLSKAELLLVY